MKSTISTPHIRVFTIALKCTFVLWSILLVNLVQAQTLKPPTVTFDPSCGSGNITLTAESEVIDNDLIFIWYDKDTTILGQENGVNGINEFITPFLIQNETFYVSLELNGFTSDLEKISTVVIHTPTILEDPWIELCTGVVLHGNIQLFDTFSSTTYQWQELTAKDLSEVSYQDIEGENGLTLSVTKTGIYRFVVTLDDCLAISNGVEVTNDLVAEASPKGNNSYCYTVDNPDDEIVVFRSGHFRSGVTTVEWYRSDDGGSTYPVLFSTEFEVDIVKPASIIDTDETWHYRLVVTEQNCSDQSDFTITWNADPRGTIRRKIDSSEANFFYCEDDAADTRTLEAVSNDNISVTWYRLLDTQFSKELHENYSVISGIDLTTLDLAFTAIGTGNEIILDQSMGGLILAKFEDLDNGCIEYSSNSIFADTAFPFPGHLFNSPDFSPYLFNAVCSGVTNLEMSSWDGTPDKFFWYFSEDNTSYVLVGSDEIYLMNSIDNPGDIEGFYKMGVEKNGCYAESDPFYIFEGDPVESIIEASNTQFCQTSDINITLSSQNQNASYSYSWYETSRPDSVLSNTSTFTPLEAGSYILEVNNLFCTSQSEITQITQLSIPEANFSNPVDTEEKFCTTLHAELIEENVDDTYAWYQSSNNFNFSQIADESALDYLIMEKGFYFATVTNTSGCQMNSDTIQVAEVLDDELNYEEIAYTCSSNDVTLLSLESPRSNQTYRWLYSQDNIIAYTDASGTNDLSTYEATELGYYQLELTGESCVLTTDPIEVRVVPVDSEVASIIEASSTQFCQTSDIVLSSQNQDVLYSYSWYLSTKLDSILSRRADFSPEQAGSYVLELNDGFCTNQSEATEITQLPIPEANFSTPIDTEERNCFTVDALLIEQNTDNTYEWYQSSDNSSFSAIAGESTVAYSLIEKGFYFATVTNASGCYINSDTIEVAELLDGELNYEEVAYTCVNSVETVLSLVSPQSNQTYRWLYSPDNIAIYTNANGTNDLATYQTTELGYYKLELTGESCVLITDPIEVRTAPDDSEVAVIIEASSTQFCQTGDITLSSQNQDALYTYSWHESSTPDIILGSNSVFNPQEAGSYILELNNGFCTAQSEAIEIIQLSVPEANFSIPVDTKEKFCSAIDAQLIEQNVDNTYAWYESSDNLTFSEIINENTLNYSLIEKGFYFAIVTNTNGCQVNSDTIEVAGFLNAELNYEEVAYTCANDEETLLWLKSPQNDETYRWLYSPDNIVAYTDASGTNDLVIYQAKELGYYQLELTSGGCVLTTDPVELQSNPEESEVEAVIIGETSVCSGSPVTLGIEDNGFESSYIWLYSTIDGELTPFSGDQEKTVTIDASQFTSETNPIQEVKVYLGIQEGSCSKLSEPLSIQTVKEPEIIVTDEINNSTLDLFICDIQNTTFNLEVSQVTAISSIDYQWEVYNPQTFGFDSIENENSTFLNITNSGVYQCVGTVPGTTCTVTSNPLEVIAPPRKISGDTTFCYGGAFDIQVDQEFLFDDAFNTFDYQWYYSDDNQAFDVIDTAQSTSLRVFSGEEKTNGGYFYYSASYNSCEIFSDILFVEEGEASVRITISGEQIQTKGQPFEISATTDQEENIVTWEPAEYGLSTNTDRAVFTIPEDYTENQIEIVAQVTNENCASARSFLIDLISSESITFSKMITPDGDNYNDIFKITGLNLSISNTLLIFDGWGKMIYEVKDYDNTPATSDQLIENIEGGNFYYVFYTGNQTYKGNFYVEK